MTLLGLMRAYAEAGFDRWHTPGHKGELDPLDFTELTDERFFPPDCVARAERSCAPVFGARHLRFLTGGSSMGVKAAVMAAGGPVITGTNNHPSVAEGLELAGTRAISIENEVRGGLPRPLTARQIDEALCRNPEAAAVLVLSPDYYGQCADADAIAAVVKKHKKLLLADAAHGAHFAGAPGLFPRSFAEVADAANLSAHKTLDAYTQSAYLCVNNDALLPAVDHALKLLGTTSPNYVLFARLEEAALALGCAEKDYASLKRRCDAFRRSVPCLPAGDFTRLAIDASALGLTGEKLARAMIERRIMPEKADSRYVILIATPRDGQDKFDRCTRAIEKIAGTFRYGNGRSPGEETAGT